jgi:hypothetical protein
MGEPSSAHFNSFAQQRERQNRCQIETKDKSDNKETTSAASDPNWRVCLQPLQRHVVPISFTCVIPHCLCACVHSSIHRIQASPLPHQSCCDGIQYSGNKSTRRGRFEVMASALAAWEVIRITLLWCRAFVRHHRGRTTKKHKHQ